MACTLQSRYLFFFNSVEDVLCFLFEYSNCLLLEMAKYQRPQSSGHLSDFEV